MRYILTNCTLPETLITGTSHKRFDTLIRKAADMGISWQYDFPVNRLTITDAPAGLESKLAPYGTVEVRADA